jgi:hypothetical protein
MEIEAPHRERRGHRDMLSCPASVQILAVKRKNRRRKREKILSYAIVNITPFYFKKRVESGASVSDSRGTRHE